MKQTKVKFNINLIFVIILDLLSSFTLVLFPLILMRIINALTINDLNEFYSNIILAIFLVLVQVCLFYFYEKFKNRYVFNCINKLRINIMSNILKLPYNLFIVNDKSEYINIMINDINELETKYYDSVFGLISKIFLLTLSSISLFSVNSSFFLIVIVILISMFILPNLFSKLITNKRKLCMKAYSQYTELINEYLDGFTVIKSYNISKEKLQTFKKKSIFLDTNNLKFKNILALLNSIFGATTIIISLAVFIIGGTLVINNIIEVGALVAVLQLIMYIIEPTSSITEYINNLKSVKPLWSRIESIQYSEIVLKAPKRLKNIESIALKSIYYKYPSQTECTLKNINLNFESGKKYAIIGGNGSGKSTLLHIVGNILKDYKGNIYINNKSIEEYDETDIYNNITYIHQEDFLFNQSIVDNIIFSKNSVENNDISLFNIFSDNESLSNKVNNSNYLIGYNGENLSGGEKQKVSILRAFYNLRNILLLDESDSALDQKSYNNLLNILNKNRDQILIFVTHKPKDILFEFDYIIEMSNGEIENIINTNL